MNRFPKNETQTEWWELFDEQHKLVMLNHVFLFIKIAILL